MTAPTTTKVSSLFDYQPYLSQLTFESVTTNAFAGAVHKYLDKTIDEIMRQIDGSGDPELILLKYVNGVHRRPI